MSDFNEATPENVQKQKLGVVIGRFQPLHNGHIDIIARALEQCEKVLVLISSATESPNYRSPLPSGTRRDMIIEEFKDPKNLVLLPLRDFPTDDEWIQEVIGFVNSFEENPSKVTLYTSEKDAAFYQTSFVYSTSVAKKEEDEIDDEAIRKLMYEDFQIPSALVPTSVHKTLTTFIASPEFTRLTNEYQQCKGREAEGLLAHAYSNPVEPVAHALVIHKGKILLVKRAGVRGHGQLALPGGFIERHETTREAAVRELKEETGLDLTTVRAMEVASAVEENLNGLSTRTIGINYAYLIDDAEEITLELDLDEVLDAQWHSFDSVVNEKVPLFYNHLTVIRRLASKIQVKQQEAQGS